MGMLKLVEDQNPEEAKRWFVVTTQNQRERTAKFHLESQHFVTYLPMRLSAHARKIGSTPLFPRHLLIELNPGVDNWRVVLSTVGVVNILCGAGDRPSALPRGAVETIREREREGLIRLEPKIVAGVLHKPGERVKVTASGPLQGLEGVFSEQVDERRCAILISLLGRDSRVVLPAGSLSAPGLR